MASVPRRTLTGAWIETWVIMELMGISGVAPSRVRGLKRLDVCASAKNAKVAPSRVRGLKLKATIEFPPLLQSHPHGCVD